MRSAVIFACLSILFLSGCSRERIGDFTGADITKSASNALSVILGRADLDGPGGDDGRLDARSPLVLPPDTYLQPPVDAERDTALLTSQWPDDPDERARREADEKAIAEAEAEARIDRRLSNTVYNSEPLSREELQAGATAPNPNYSSAEEVRSRQLASRAMTPEELLNRNTNPRDAANSGAPGPPTHETANRAQGISTAPTPPRATTRELTAPPNMQDSPPGGAAQSGDRRGILDRLRFWRSDS